MHSKIAVGLDIGTHTTRVVVAELRPNEHPLVLATGKSETLGMHHGYVINRYEAVKSVRQAIRNAEKNWGKTISTVYLGIGGISLASDTINITISLDQESREVRPSDMTRLHRACERALLQRSVNVRIIHSIPLKYQVDDQQINGNPVGLTGNKITCKMMAITALEHHFEDLISVVTEAGLDILDVVASPLAAGLVALDNRQIMAGCGLVDIGAETVSLVVYENTLPVSLQVFALGASDITNDIALGFRIPLEQAERIKIGKNDSPQQFPKAKIEDIVQARLTDIFELIEKHLTSIGRNGLLPAGIVLTGGGSVLASIEDFTRAALKLPAKVIKIENLNQVRKRLPDNSWIVAYGLCSVAQEQKNPMFRRERIVKDLLRTTKDRILTWLKELLP